MAWINGCQDDRRAHQPDDTEHGDRDEPHHHDRPEQSTDTVGAVALDGKHGDQDPDRDGDDVGFEERCRKLEPLDGTEYRDCRRNHAVAVEQRGAEDTEQDENRPTGAMIRAFGQQRRQRKNPALALVVCAHDNRDVLD